MTMETETTITVAGALAAVDALAVADRNRRDTAFLHVSAVNYGAGSTPAANLRELIALRKLADAVRANPPGMAPEAISEILAEIREEYARFSRGDDDIFRKLENRLVPLTPGEPVQFRELGRLRWFNGTYEGPVDNPDDPQRSGDVVVLSRSGRRVPVFLSSVQRRSR
jgi:hypothetical protein